MYRIVHASTFLPINLSYPIRSDSLVKVPLELFHEFIHVYVRTEAFFPMLKLFFCILSGYLLV